MKKSSRQRILPPETDVKGKNRGKRRRQEPGTRIQTSGTRKKAPGIRNPEPSLGFSIAYPLPATPHTLH
jgi:hypothetical protein